MRYRWQWLVFGTIGVLVAGACSDSLSIDDVLGEWEAISVNGASVPGDVVIHVGDSTQTISIEYDRFRFYEGGSCVSLVRYETASETECEYRANIERQSITIEFPTVGPPFVMNIPGTFHDGLLTLTIPNRGGAPNVSVYRRRGDLPSRTPPLL